MSKYKKIIFSFLSFFLITLSVLICLEVLLAFYTFIEDGKFTSSKEKIYSQINTAQINQTNPEMTDNGDNCRWTDMFKTHPYLMYVKKNTGQCSEVNINPQGFRGPAYPLKKIDRVFIIMFSGGSVAEAQMGAWKTTLLEKKLNAEYKMQGYDRFKVIVGALAAWRQPNQMIMLSLYSQILNGYINLDGVNEFSIIDDPQGRMAGWPSDPMAMQGINDFVDIGKYIFARCDGYFLKKQLNSNFLNNFYTFYYTAQSIRNYCRKKSQDLSMQSPYMSFFKFPENTPLENQKKYNQSQFMNYVRNIHYLAKGNNIKELHFIQPTPAYKKILSQEEASIVGDLSYKKSYDDLIKARMSLVKEGIPMIDLTNIFRDNVETLYIDHVHLNKKGRDLLQDQIIFYMQKHWGLKKK